MKLREIIEEMGEERFYELRDMAMKEHRLDRNHGTARHGEYYYFREVIKNYLRTVRRLKSNREYVRAA